MAFAKTTRPTVRGAIARPRLHRLLGRRNSRPVTWIWGPPGAGKTTLVAGFIAASSRPTIWYQVDAGDADVATFFYYLGLAAPRARQPLPLLTPEYPLGAFARRYFRELYRRLKPPFVLVFDNYQEVPADAPLHEVLRDAIEELPAGGRIIVISRSAPPPALARQQLHQQFDIVDWTALRLTFAEARAVVRGRSRRATTPREVRKLHELADGWVTGLVLLSGRPAAAKSVETDSPEVLFDYFAGEIYSKAPERTRHVLLHTAFLPNIRPAVAVALTGEPAAGDIVADLHRTSYFTNRLTGSVETYAYHPLYREFLIARARRELDPAEVAAIQTRAATLLEAQGEIDAAQGLLRDAGNLDALAELICRHAPALLAQGRIQTLEGWLRGAGTVVAHTPWLLCWRGVCQLGRRHDACRADCEAALNAFQRQADAEGALLCWATIVTSYVIEGRLAPLDDWIPRLDTLTRELAARPSAAVEARVAVAMLLAITYRQPGHFEGARWADRALTSTQTCPDLTLRAVAACGWVLYHWVAGDATKAPMAVDDMRLLLRQRNLPPLVALNARFAILVQEFFTAERGWQRTFNELREHARAAGIAEHAVATASLVWGSFAALADDDLELAGSLIRTLGSEAGRMGPTYLFAYHGAVIREALARRDLPRARTYVDELRKQGFTTGFSFDRVIGHSVAAYMHSAAGESAQALEHVHHAVEEARQVATPFLVWMADLTHAHVAFAAGQDAAGEEALRRALARGRAQGYCTSQLWMPDVMAHLCARALDANIEPAYAADLVRRRGLVCDPPPLDVEAWPWSIRMAALGRFGIHLDDQPLTWSGKVPRKPLALLKVLIARGPGAVREGVLMDTLWPDAEGDAARRALTTALFRLRRLLGHEAAVLRFDGQIGLNPLFCWVDVWAAERLLDKSTSAAQRGDGAGAVRWVRRAAALYAGPLVSADEDEADSQGRDLRLRSRLMRQLLATASALEPLGEWQQVIDLVEDALRIDPCNEDAYAKLMVAHHRLGRPAEVRAIYDRCRRSLVAAGGSEPSRRIATLVTQLTGQ